MITHVPDMTFKTRVRDDSIGGDNPFTWYDLTTDELFANKKKWLCFLYQVPLHQLVQTAISLVMKSFIMSLRHWA